MKRNSRLDEWPSFLRGIFRALGIAMKDGQLHPDVLKQLPAIEDQELFDQHWECRHITGEAAKPGGNRYQITISGNRISGHWNFRSGELARLAREASAKSQVNS